MTTRTTSPSAFRVRRDALAASLAHVHKNRLGPTETLEQLAEFEERARAAVNLARRTCFACLGSFKTIDRFDWSHPEKIDRALIERLLLWSSALAQKRRTSPGSSPMS